VLFGVGGKNIQCYTPQGGPHDAWRPHIHAIAPLGGGHYRLKGTQLNGLSQANIYGDDCYPATNYPLVRLKNDATHKVYYCRTYDFSTMGVATGGALESVRFRVPSLPHGSYDLCVVANGISSHCVDFPHHREKRHEHEEKGEERCCQPCWQPCYCQACGCGDGDREDAEMREIRDEVRRLQNSMHRLASMVQREDVQEKKEVTKEHKEKRERDDDDEREAHRKEKHRSR
jgi:hypothetical protein